MGEGWPSRRKYISMNVTFFAALVAFAATFAVVMLFKPGSPTAADLSRIQKGMTPAEVRAILGEPKSSLRQTLTPGDPEETWTYSLPASHWSVVNDEYQMKFYQGKFDSWWKIE